jgi:DNA processing protein
MASFHYWLALHKIPNVNWQTLKYVLSNISTLAELFSLNKKQLLDLKLSPKSINAILHFDWDTLSSDIAWLNEPTHHLLTLDHSDYPKLLYEIEAPPVLLFVYGNVACLQTPQIAVVGSRTPTYTGMDIAKVFAKQLACAGLTITSGLAYGIDRAAHQGALDQAGKTIAVLGSGIKRIYPCAHKRLAQNIIDKGGAIISEFPLNQPPLRSNFPKRNRIISGLSLGVLVVEAAEKSGSLITAKHALDANREVFAIPGSIRNTLSAGCHMLIQQGAKLVSHVNDILEEIQISSPLGTHTSIEKHQKAHLSLDSTYQKLLECIGYEPLPVNELIKRSELTAEKVTAMLITLEMNGYIQSTLKGYLKI